MKGLFNQHGHLTGFALEALKNGTLTEEELIRATSHIAECLHCAEAFSDSFMEPELEKVPYGFADEIMRKLLLPREEVISPEETGNPVDSKKVRTTGKIKLLENRRLLAYSFRVAVAVCASLAIVFSGFLDFYANAISYSDSESYIDRYIDEDRYSEKTTTDQKIVNYVNDINSGLRDFSQKILNMEVLFNETEKK